MLVKQQRIEEMLDEIQRKRKRMIETARKSGLTSDDTIRLSQELDRLIYEYQCLFSSLNRKEREPKFACRQLMLFWPKIRAKA